MPLLHLNLVARPSLMLQEQQNWQGRHRCCSGQLELCMRRSAKDTKTLPPYLLHDQALLPGLLFKAHTCCFPVVLSLLMILIIRLLL